MKKFINILSLITVAALAVVSCVKEKAEHEPGPAEAAGCYGVYFPTQDASGSHIYNPTQDPSVEITVARTNTKGAITVPVKTTFSEDGIFVLSDISFADGQAETTTTLRFDNAKEGVNYAASIEIQDNNYASLYSEGAIALDFSLMRVEMKTMEDEKGKPAKFTFTVKPDFLSDFGISEVYEVEGSIQYYEVDGIRYGSVVVPADGGIWKSGAVINFTWYPKVEYVYEDVSYEAVEVGVQNTGYELDGSEVGEDHPCAVLFCDYYHHYSDLKGNSLGTFQEFLKNYGQDYKLSYYDGHGGFYFNLVYDIEGTNYWYGFCDGSVVGIGDGFTRTDFTLEVEQAGVTVGEEVPVSFKLGPDVAKVVCNFVEGTLTATQTENAIAALDPKAASDITRSGVYSFALDATGVYTLVAIAVDAEGKIQNSASAPITYLAPEDAEDYEVIVNAGLSTAEEYVPKGINPESALEIYIYGTDLQVVKFGLFSYQDLISDYEGCLEAVQEGDPISATALAAVNGEGYVDVVTSLLPGTEYYAVVYASNGYADNIDVYGPATTLGDPLPIYQKFNQSSIKVDLLPETSEGYFGKYNFYAVNFFDNETGLREYASKVTIADSEVPDSEPDEDGLKSEYLEISGMFDGAAKYYGFDDTQLWECYDGVLYNLGAEGQQLGAVADGKYYAQLFVLTSAGSLYRNYPSMLLGAFVDDGYIAFMSSELYNGGTLGENGLFLRFYGDDAYSSPVGNVDGWTDLLLVDEKKDENGLAPSTSSIAPKKAQLHALSEKLREPRTNFVETPRGYIRTLIDNYNKSVKASGVVAGIKGGVCPLNVATVKSVKYVGPAASVRDSAPVKKTLAPSEL